MSKQIVFLVWIVLGLYLSLNVPAGAELFMVEHFNYPAGADLNGQVLGQGAWSAGTGYSMLNDDALGDGGTSSLQYPGLIDAQGGRVIPAGDIDYYLDTPITGEGSTVYLSLLLKPMEIASGYFLYFDTEGSVQSQLGRLRGEDSGGQQRLGVSLRGSGGTAWADKTVALGETVFVVMKLTMVPGSDNDTVEIWINPAVGQPEPPADGISSVDPGNDVDPEVGIGGFETRDQGVHEIDEIRFGTTWDDVVGSLGSPRGASLPRPSDSKDDVPRAVVLSWSPGDKTAPPTGYTLFLSDDVNDVSDGIGGIVLDANEYIPDTLLDYGVTYYWRVDEGDIAGPIWSFQIEPLGRPVPTEAIAVVADSNTVGQGPENTINGSGLTGDLHSSNTLDMWLSDSGMASRPVLQYSFDKAYKLYELWIWNYNGEGLNTFSGCKEVTIEYSLDGDTWNTVHGMMEIPKASGTDGQLPDVKVDCGNLTAKHIKLTVHTNWSGGFVDQYGLSEVRFLYIPVFARLPQPSSGETVSLDGILTWRPGREAVLHNLYVGTDPNALSFIDTISPSSYDTLPLDLQLDQTYYWRIDEVNEAEDPNVWEGDLWHFTIPASELIDGMESYNGDEQAGTTIWQTWEDGYEIDENGSQVGDFDGLPGKDMVRSGRQSMPFYYGQGTATDSWAKRTFADSRNWARAGIQGLVLYFHGAPENALSQLYVKINDVRVLFDGDAETLQRVGWQKWYIPLADHVQGNELAQVTSLTIGVEGSGEGLLIVDDILLTKDSRVLLTPATPANDNLVAHYAFEGNASDSTGSHPGTVMGLSNFEAGKVGQAIRFAGVFGDYVEITGYKGILGSGPITVTAWINTRATETGTIMAWGGPIVEGNRFDFRVNDNRLRGEFSGGNIQGASIVNDGGWHHVAMTVQANATASYPEVVLWVDGQDDTIPSTDDTIVNILAESDARIGMNPSYEGRWFGGLIDELYLYDRVLTPEEIAGAAGRIAPFDP
jgi:hypothetical protein